MKKDIRDWHFLAWNMRCDPSIAGHDAVNCDCYDFPRQIPCVVSCYRGEYMKQCSRVEMTTVFLPDRF